MKSFLRVGFAWMVLACLVSAADARESGEGGHGVGNGGGLSEMTLVHAYRSLPSLLNMCLLTESCDLSREERGILHSIARSFAQEPGLVFRSNKEFDFRIDGPYHPEKTFVTGDRVGDPIYVNLGQIYYPDSQIPKITEIPAAAGMLVHELGHHHVNNKAQVKACDRLNALGSKVRAYLESVTHVATAPLVSDIRLITLKSDRPSAVMPDALGFEPLFTPVIVQDGGVIVDVTQRLFSILDCGPGRESLQVVGFSVISHRWGFDEKSYALWASAQVPGPFAAGFDGLPADFQMELRCQSGTEVVRVFKSLSVIIPFQRNECGSSAVEFQYDPMRPILPLE